MIVLKSWYHFCFFIKCFFLKAIYGKQIIIGKNTTWRKSLSVMIDKDAKLTIGDNCFFNNFCSINVMQNVSIGNGTVFGENVKIYDHNHRFYNPKVPINEQGFSCGEVKIGNHCWIGSNVTILKGAQISDNCVIGAGCVIDGLITEGTIIKEKREYIVEKIREK